MDAVNDHGFVINSSTRDDDYGNLGVMMATNIGKHLEAANLIDTTMVNQSHTQVDVGKSCPDCGHDDMTNVMLDIMGHEVVMCQCENCGRWLSNTELVSLIKNSEDGE